MAIEREPVTLQELVENWVEAPPRRRFLEAVRSLQRRGLVESAVDRMGDTPYSSPYHAHFVLQNVVMEYVSEVLIEHFFDELVETPLGAAENAAVPHAQRWLTRYTLVKAQAKVYVREAQARLLLQPLVRRLVNQWGRSHLLHRLQEWLTYLHQEQQPAAGYAGTNLLHLLLQLGADLCGWNFSRLSLRQADLRTEALAHVNLEGADLRDAAFINTIDIIHGIALSADGQYWAVGSSTGTVYIWRTVDYQLHCVLHYHTQGVSALAFATVNSWSVVRWMG